MDRNTINYGLRRWNAPDWLVSPVCSRLLDFPSKFLTAIAVGRDMFREDSRKLCELLMQIQSESYFFSLGVRRDNRVENR